MNIMLKNEYYKIDLMNIILKNDFIIFVYSVKELKLNYDDNIHLLNIIIKNKF